ncbi:MAG: class I tRNA ligase family protein [Anaerolineae bacterium]|nr:class I tRNA ligase family protein [Anaerolineae bacterium]MDW8071450.1 class I tRNA ligase family protein [Anaerolineae bacterium]
MPFREVPANVDFIAQEYAILRFWKETRAFEVMRELHRGQPPWSFLDGPITANNPMGVHHGWGRTYKDLYNRFWTMRGRELRYQNGFDCQGLWVEVEVEKELGFRSKRDIEAYGLDRFVRKCKERVLRYAAVQTEQSIRLGYWMDWNDPDQLRWLADLIVEDPSRVITIEGPLGPVTDTVEQIVGRLGMPELGGSYFTFSNENNYMIWTFLKKCWQKGWLYRGADVMPWCPRCATGISQHEIVTDGYVELTHPSVTLRFPLRNRPGESLLVWTTTPWTLTSNVAAAVGPELTYVKVRHHGEILYLSKGTLHMLKGPYEVLAEMPGFALEGWTYEGPFDELEAARMPGGCTDQAELIRDIQESAQEAHRVILWDGVGEAEGTGIVHIAPGCGAEDFQLAKQYRLPLVAPLDEEGYFTPHFEPFTGRHVTEVREMIFEHLRTKGLLYDVSTYTHRYPVCWRCKTELVFRLVDEWFISMGPVYDKPREALTKEEKERSLRYQIMDIVSQIRWIPEFGYAREMDWLYNMHDWMISKKRYWGLALPFWTCPQCGHYEVIGDELELEARAVAGWEAFVGHTPHRPYIDAIKIRCSRCQELMSRIPDVGNPWLDAGIVSFSTLRYRSDREYWRKWYPAHWISESFPGQFRNWFYSLLAMATVLENSPPFLQNFGYATLLAEDGRPMHKSWGNAIEFNDAADKMGVDVMRWLYCSQKPDQNLLFGYRRADETRRRFLIPLWNVYNFFVTYARLDQWEPAPERFDPAHPEGEAPQTEALLDRWILARINQLTAQCTQCLEDSDAYTATILIEELLDDLTNWYVRRSRRRFWKSERDTDKKAAYATLYYVLVRLVRLLAPFTPFVTEVMYQNLVREVRPQAYGSVHHTSWPVADMTLVDEHLLARMALARRIASVGLGARGSANVKVRQPLAKALVHLADTELATALDAEMRAIIMDELNVKSLELVADESALVRYQVLPDNKLLGPRLGAAFPKVRAALATADAAQLAKQVRSGLPISLSVDGDTVQLLPEELIIQTQPMPGLAVMSEKGITVAVDIVITPALRSEGLAREIVRRIQTQRKEAGFNIEDRITTYYVTDGELAEVIREWADYIKAETLSLSMQAEQPPSEAFIAQHTIEGMPITLGVRRLQ